MTDDEVLHLKDNTDVLYNGDIWQYKKFRKSWIPLTIFVTLQQGCKVCQCVQPQDIVALPETKFIDDMK